MTDNTDYELDKILGNYKQALYNVWLQEQKAERHQTITSAIKNAEEADRYIKQAIRQLIDEVIGGNEVQPRPQDDESKCRFYRVGGKNFVRNQLRQALNIGDK